MSRKDPIVFGQDIKRFDFDNWRKSKNRQHHSKNIKRLVVLMFSFFFDLTINIITTLDGDVDFFLLHWFEEREREKERERETWLHQSNAQNQLLEKNFLNLVKLKLTKNFLNLRKLTGGWSDDKDKNADIV